MKIQNYYEILGVTRNSTTEEIKKKNYRKLALQYHPDRNSENTAIFQEINQAAEILCDNEKRRNYDQQNSTFDGSLFDALLSAFTKT